MPKITVLMSVYNGSRYLRQAIESILCQTWSDFEYLIINDGSTDNSRDIVLSFDDPRIRLVDNPSNIGLTKSLNRGLQLAQAEYIARQDADDISYPERLERQVQFLDEYPDVALLGTRARAIDEKGKSQKENLLRTPIGLLAIRWYLMFQNAFIHSAVIFRRSIIWEKLGGYDESFVRAQDYELWSRIARLYDVANLADVLLDHRFEYGSIVSHLPLALAPEEDIALTNLRVFLKYPDVPVAWGRYINNFRRKNNFDQGEDWRQVAEMFDQISSRYCQLYPEAKLNKTIRSHLADYLYWLAYYSAPHNHHISFKSYKRARKLASKSHRNPSLVKYIILWCTGEYMQRAYYCLRSSAK
ncbi:MAG: glycosyltransferase [Desulfobacteraceae bacterium]|jgi:glycosyltransferase involved in cell wall biosynthesis